MATAFTAGYLLPILCHRFLLALLYLLDNVLLLLDEIDAEITPFTADVSQISNPFIQSQGVSNGLVIGHTPTCLLSPYYQIKYYIRRGITTTKARTSECLPFHACTVIS
jgi:hypothetical protein